MEFERILSLRPLLERNSFFLFGPRATGKSSLIREQLRKDALVIDLLKASAYQRLLENPSSLEAMIDAAPSHAKFTVLDEIQRIPEPLNEVHRLIEERRMRFLLCGSSARKLKKQGVNLLAGRAWMSELFPLVSAELGDEFILDRYLRYGGLPRIWSEGRSDQDAADELDSYVSTYLKEEIQQEGLVRKLQMFSGFLRLAALNSGQLLNYDSIAREVGVSPPTIREYYSILKDTLIAFELEPFSRTKKRKPVSTSKIYLFDTGITNFLAEITSLDRNSDLYGHRLEQWIAIELRAYLSYRRIKAPLSFWRSLDQKEVDFVIGDRVAVEVKSSRRLAPGHFKGLKALQEEKIVRDFWMVSHDPIAQKIEGVTCVPVLEFVRRLWNDELLGKPKGG